MRILILFFSILFVQCSDKPINGDKLSRKSIDYIQKLGLLESNEQIIVFYPAFGIETSGNFITNKRVASYWQYTKDTKDNYIKSALYSEIDSIGVKYGDGFEFVSALVIRKKTGEKFDVYFNDTNENIERLRKMVEAKRKYPR